MDKMVKLQINGKAIEAKAGSSVFQAAASAGVFIPHYCYHPDLSVAGVCRMCMVDIEKQPRLQISCNTPVAEGMIVRTDNEKVRDWVKNVLELHLINHPIDCPICDKAGECKLQDFYSEYGLYASRMEYEKVHKPKVVDIGTIVLDEERCILCTRCVRFTAEVTKTNELGIFNRGDRSELRTYDHGPLKNDYTGNLADICPVGALTAKDFRFRQRVWFLEKTESVCGSCAQGCNTALSVNPSTKKLFRVEPRRNPEVNKSWICDRGRWEFHALHAESRIQTPKLRRGNVIKDITWHEAFGVIQEEISKDPAGILVALSTHMTNEEIADAFDTFTRMGVKNFTWVVDESVVEHKKPYDGLLKHKDLSPNAEGFARVAAAFGVTFLKGAGLSELAKKGTISRVIILGLEGEAPPGAAGLLKLFSKQKIAVHASNLFGALEVADLIVPNVTTYEKTGTFVNAQGRLQKVNPALPWQFIARDAHAVVFGISRGSDREALKDGRAKELFEAVVAPKLGQTEWTFRKFSQMGVALK